MSQPPEAEPDWLMISALQHYAYCPRQFALIHIEQVWEENQFTAHGRLLHERVDSYESEQRGDVRYERSISVLSNRLCVRGKLDLLEIIGKSAKSYFPVEYKRGKSKAEDWDRIQLCAQALCLEEMREIRIDSGALWYWQVRKRETVQFDQALRNATQQTIEAAHALMASGQTPQPTTHKQRCRACSLIDLCEPEAVSRLAASLRRAKQAQSVAEAMGIEGDAASIYFGVFNELLRGSGFHFNGRVRRPPTDPVNALLSYLYTLITHECSSAIQGVGLDPYVGFLHQDRPGRLSLALDLLEEFRAPWADRFVLTLVNRKQIQPRDFINEASGAVRLTEDGRKRVLIAWQERKQVEINHPYLQEKVAIGLLPHCQAMLLARHIRGDTEYYPPYLVK